MAKKKIKKDKTKDTGYRIEVLGILLILLAIIGLSPFGLLSDIIRGFSGFLTGSWFFIVPIMMGIYGGYIMVKRARPDLVTTKLIGLYILILGILILSHLGYVNDPEVRVTYGNIIGETLNNLQDFMGGTDSIAGGGMIGAIFAVTLVKLLTVTGVYVVSLVIILCGFILFTGIAPVDMWNFFKKGFKKTVALKDKVVNKEAISKAEEEFDKNNKVIISSMDEIIQTDDSEEVEIVELETGTYNYPPVTLLKKITRTNDKQNEEAVKETVPLIQDVFNDFGVEGKVVAINIGPAVTQYELDIKAGTKLSKITSLDRELALALAAKSVKIQAPIPGKKTVGLEIPNKKTSFVSVRELLETVPKNLNNSKLLITLGKNILGKPIYYELNNTPHLLVAGATGSGKSVCINSMLISLLMRAKPDEVKLVLIDPKKVELSAYNGIPHLLTPVVTDPKKANIVLKKIVSEMERRYELFEKHSVKNIAGYNTMINKRNKTKDEHGQEKKLPYIVVIIDELADLMLVAAKEVEDSILRITQMARAAGIHLIVATQRPSTDVITGIVKSNIPSRISFAVSSSIDSRTILDMTGAEKLLGRGDMLFLPQGENIPVRVQGTHVTDEDIKAVVNFVISQQKARYDETIVMTEEEMGTGVTETDATEEPLYNEIVEFVVTQGKASASLLQRRFRLGYNRAARAVDLLEERGIVGPPNGSKPREVLVKLEEKDQD